MIDYSWDLSNEPKIEKKHKRDKYSKGQTVTIRTGTIEQICRYPDIGLVYYGVRMYEPWSKKFDLVFVEEKVLNKLMDISKIDKNIVSTTHIGDYNELY